MTRLPLQDSHAQAANRITGRGYLLVPAIEPGSTFIVDRPEQQTPFPAVGEAFFVGEAWKPLDLLCRPDHALIDVAYRAASPHSFERRQTQFANVINRNLGREARWNPAHHMPEWAARTRFRVLSRSALRLGDVTEEMASGMGIEVVPFGALAGSLWGPPDRTGGRLPWTPRGPLIEWWPLWTRTAYNTRSWAFVAHVERL